jgi:hypothetical protein
MSHSDFTHRRHGLTLVDQHVEVSHPAPALIGRDLSGVEECVVFLVGSVILGRDQDDVGSAEGDEAFRWTYYWSAIAIVFTWSER